MSRKRSRKPRPKPGPDVLTVDKLTAATAQLEAAIFLWFNMQNPIPIHGLAAAALDCLHALGGKSGKPSLVETWIKSQRSAARERARYFQSFIKHGFKDLDETVDYSPKHGEVLMTDAVVCYEKLFHKKTPLMFLFLARYILENPDVILPEGKDFIPTGAYADYVTGLNRKDFMNEILPLLISKMGMPGFHLAIPPEP